MNSDKVIAELTVDMEGKNHIERDQKSVSVVMPIIIKEEWQAAMTMCAIDTLRCTTSIPYELIIVETESLDFNPDNFGYASDKYIHVQYKGNCTADLNKGLELATGDIIIYTGNDIFVRPGWLEAVLKCFEIPDCGAATLASSDLKMTQKDLIMEGIYGPFMAFESHWRFDEANFPYTFADSDLITRIYKNGQRMYRNWNVVIHHLNRQTLVKNSDVDDFQFAKNKYIAKHKDCPLFVYRALVDGMVI